MDMFISLSHFCDKHGPRVLLVTQMNFNSSDNDPLLLPDYPLESYCDSCILHFPPVSTKQDIRSMRSVLTHHNHQISFVSTQYSSIRYQLLSSIIRKTFSEETMIYDMTPMIFQDDINKLNFVMGFKLHDENARGNERRYCLTFSIDSTDHLQSMQLLSANIDFIINGFQKMIGYIKQLRDVQLNTLAKQGQLDDNLTPIISTYLRGNKTKSSKNLTCLTNDKGIFVKLHKWNTFLLSSLYKKCHEKYERDE
ncbi:hypothetical protein TBLA_0D02030 [Henningerozyma blattae CBS 6284]|uniref:UDENN FLCN/SMCR8-type domain-containing protein n=1 Tax=Henningerozyma blattae (strain ATCC 34711 / CBS 6284 / DSM 70876 / NBRC 10599 / NRRL Y-10934 / UCD 77-7) TaxID=1071380 RepID=I2H2V8_HENB6|nr:hypothetical protein TBLA_0D02030 [Tetrapisispora blattae CBS 6284]CCH60710.1 hypothetical protein TBLA_0D02030 [Tetrapisispora blattae CBS 6284]